MRVVYSPAHLGHEIRTQTQMGVQVPASEIAERAEVIRDALAADGGFELVAPTEHGEDPITAVHDPGLLAFLRDAWADAGRGRDPARVPRARDDPTTRCMTEGMSDAVRRDPRHIAGRSGYRALDTSTPIVEGTYAAARAAVDVALTAVDLVLGGDRGRLRAVPAARPPRRALDVRRLLLLQQRRDRGRGDRRAPPASPSRSSTSTTTTATAPSRSSGAVATSCTSRSTPTPTASTRTSSAGPTRPGEGPGDGRQPQPPAAGRDHDDEQYLEALDRGLERSPTTAGRRSWSRSASTPTGSTRSGDFALTTDVYHEVGRRAAATGKRLVILQEGGYYVARPGRERPRLAPRRRGPALARTCRRGMRFANARGGIAGLHDTRR